MVVLMIDLDTKDDEEKMRILWALRMLSPYVAFKEAKVYETRKGFHIYIYVDQELDPIETIALQQLLGSDRNRGVFNYIRVKRGFRKWQVLYKRKYAKFEDGELELSEERITPDAVVLELMANATMAEAQVTKERERRESGDV